MPGRARAAPARARATAARKAGASNGVAPAPGGVIEIQRARILAAITELVREQGVAGITVAHIVKRSCVSRRTFYDLFIDRDDCLLAAFERALERAAAVVLPAYEAAGVEAKGGRSRTLRLGVRSPRTPAARGRPRFVRASPRCWASSTRSRRTVACWSSTRSLPIGRCSNGAYEWSRR